MSNDFAYEILNAREERFKKQREIIKEYRYPIVTLMVNTPGLEKNNSKVEHIFTQGVARLLQIFKEERLTVVHQTWDAKKVTGPEGLFVIQAPAKIIKQFCLILEESHPLGRLWDIDVIDINCKPISRELLGYKPRKCYVCGNSAKNCARNQSHSFDETISKFYKISNPMIHSAKGPTTRSGDKHG